MKQIVVVFVLLILSGLTQSASGQDLFLLDGRRPRKAILATEEVLDSQLVSIQTDMTDAMVGVLLRYDRKTIKKLLGCLTSRKSSDDRLPRQAEYYAHLFAQEDDLEPTRVVSIAHEPGTGQYLAWDSRRAQSIEDAKVLHGMRFDREREKMPLFQGSRDPMSHEGNGGQGNLMAKPYCEADLKMDKRTMRERLHGGAINRKRLPTKRNLLTEDLYVRLPLGYDPREPTGLLVWCSASPSGLIPNVFEPALDELNLIAVGVANAGNDRPISDRIQLMLDARANVLKRYHVDPQRVYMSGISGGGRVTASMSVCFPEYIYGSVSIVGFSSYERFENLASTVGKPPAKWLAMAKDRPFAMVTGPKDFNYKEMKGRLSILQREGFQRMRMFEYPEMAHTLPGTEQFAEALRWVDAFYQSKQEQREAKASLELEAYRKDRDDPVPANSNDREALVKIVREYPWTSGANQALVLLLKK